MTRYLCVHPGHERKGRGRPVDVTAQVRLEREFLPRESAYLASTDDVIARVLALRTGDPVDRLAQVRRALTGTAAPIDAPVVLAASSTDRVPGLYELDELRSDPAIATLIDRRAQAVPSGTDDVVVITDVGGASGFESASQTGVAPTAETITATQLERAQQARVLPQGIFPVMELSARIADSPADERAIVETIKGTSMTRAPLGERTSPWRVVVECPTPVGDPPASHRVVFTGTGDPEPLEVLGTPAVGWDLALEDAAVDDLAPPAPSRRSERRLKSVLVAQLVIAALIAGAAWASGALSLAVRETPGWLGFAVTLGVAALALGLIALLGRSDADGNANDTFVLRRHYASRTQLLATATLVSAGLFAFAVASAVVPPILDAEPPVPAPLITFAAGNRVVTATVQVDGDGIATDDVVAVEVRQYSAEEAEGVLIGRVTATGDSAGRVRVREAMALDRGARFMTVLVTVGDRSAETCTPSASGGAGCSVVAVPPLGAGIVRFEPAESLEALIAETETTPSPALSPSVPPSPTASPGVTTSPSISPTESPA
jgi:hypothetical protein